MILRQEWADYRLSIFQKIKRTDVLWMFIFAVLNLIITISLGLLVTHFFQTSPNPVNSMIENLHADEARRLIDYSDAIMALEQSVS